jgi:bifunctional UDP-N-acetylglucosamine pyrophosphorylase / glucosamine-1-phosphate N-acetyltransferase
MSAGKPHVLILAAGRGKRMHSDLPKVLHPVLYRPMLHYVLDLAQSIDHASISVVVGFGEKEVRERCTEYEGVQFLTQKKQLGTADAVKTAKEKLAGQEGSLIVLSGDVILLTKATMDQLLEKHARRKAACTLVTAKVPSPKGYGRILRNQEGKMFGIREEADCSDTEREIQEVNAGIYCFDIKLLFAALERISSHNEQQEYYLTDVIEIFNKDKQGLATVRLEDPRDMTGINDRAALSEVESLLQARVNRELMLSGVRLQNPSSIFIDPRCRIEKDVVVEQGCYLVSSVLEAGVVVESHSRIVNSLIGRGSHVKQGSYITDSQVGADCNIGPYAHFRPGTRLESGVKVGNFVEVKKSLLRPGAKASHLSYIGDADIGKNVNLGCGFITCNYDGSPTKHKTVIEDDVFVGSDSQTVAPVTIGARSYVASGTTVSGNVPADSLALSRGRLVVKEGYAEKYRKKNTPQTE